jgi:hypothetical protein
MIVGLLTVKMCLLDLLITKKDLLKLLETERGLSKVYLELNNIIYDDSLRLYWMTERYNQICKIVDV